jgi:predicted phosphoribosyltransferase
VTRVVEIDLDDPNSIATGWAAVERVFAIRNADPETRQDLVRLMPLLDEGTRAEIERVIDDVPPIVILRVPELFEALAEANRPGCMRRSEVGRDA